MPFHPNTWYWAVLFHSATCLEQQSNPKVQSWNPWPSCDFRADCTSSHLLRMEWTNTTPKTWLKVTPAMMKSDFCGMWTNPSLLKKSKQHYIKREFALMIVSLNRWFHRKISRATRSLSESYYRIECDLMSLLVSWNTSAIPSGNSPGSRLLSSCMKVQTDVTQTSLPKPALVFHPPSLKAPFFVQRPPRQRRPPLLPPTTTRSVTSLLSSSIPKPVPPSLYAFPNAPSPTSPNASTPTSFPPLQSTNVSS